jgi:hypothetical protein
MRGAFLFFCKFFCKKLSEFRFRRKANQIRNRRANYNSFGTYSNSLSLQEPLADPARRGPSLLFSCSNPLTQTR